MTFPLYCRLHPTFHRNADYLDGYQTREYLGPSSWTKFVCATDLLPDVRRWGMWDLGFRAAAYAITGRAALQ